MDFYWKEEQDGRKTLVIFPKPDENREEFDELAEGDITVKKVPYGDERLGIASIEISQHEDTI